MTSSTLSTINLYPVISLAGISVTHWPVTKTGLHYDRKWMLIDNAGQFLSQRQLPQMALIKTAFSGGDLLLSAPGMENLLLPLTQSDGEAISSTIWRDQCETRSVSRGAGQWLSSFLNHNCRLVYQPDEMVRQVDPHYGRQTDNVAFSDGFPFLIISENSLVSLNQEMQLNLPMMIA